MTNAEPKQNKRQTKTEFETNTNVNEKCKTLGQNASPLFLPQWWMSATQVKSGRKSPISKNLSNRQNGSKIPMSNLKRAAGASAPPVRGKRSHKKDD